MHLSPAIAFDEMPFFAFTPPRVARRRSCSIVARRTGSRFMILLVASGYLTFLAINHSTQAQVAASEPVGVTVEEVPSAYGAPPGMSRSRFSNLTNAYVLPPWAVYAGIIYQGDALR